MAIPKIIHYCWVGGKPLPELALKCIESWKKFCPDYEIKEWNESNYDFSKNRYMKEAYDAKKWGFVPDFARLDIIYKYGGIYLDTDVEIVKNLDSLLEYPGYIGYEAGPDKMKCINLGLGFGAEPKNPLIKKIMDEYENLSFFNDDGTYNLTPSPQINTKTLRKLGLKCKNSFQTIDDFTFLPKDYLCPKNFFTGKIKITKNTYSIHHYDASWMDRVHKKSIKIRRYFWFLPKKYAAHVGKFFAYVSIEGFRTAIDETLKVIGKGK